MKPTSLHYFDACVIALSFTVWTLPIAFGLRADMGLRTALLVPMLLILLVKFALYRPRLGPGQTDAGWLLVIAFLGLWIVAFARTALFHFELDPVYIIGYWLYLAWLSAFVIFAYARHGRSPERGAIIRLGVVCAPGLYVVVNVLLFMLGFRQPNSAYLAEYPAQMLLYLGMHWNRTLFPLADGINAFGVMAGATTVMYLPYLFRSGALFARSLAAIVIVAGLAAIVMTDSRTALLLVAAFAVARFLPDRVRMHVRWVPLAVSALPVAAMLVAAPALDDFHALERPRAHMDSAQISTLRAEFCQDRIAPQGGALSNRPLVWRTVLDEFSVPSTVHLLGYGFRGQAVAGISGELSCVFLSHANRHLTSAHNIWLQTLVEIGYLGLAVTVGLVIWLIHRLTRLRTALADPGYSGLTYGVLYIIAAGTLESTLSPDYNGTFLIFLLALLCAGLGRETSLGS